MVNYILGRTVCQLNLHCWGKDVKYRGNLFSINIFLKLITNSKAHIIAVISCRTCCCKDRGLKHGVLLKNTQTTILNSELKFIHYLTS